MTAPARGFEAAAEPLKFLDYFTREDRARFHGRNEEIERVTVGVLQSRTFVLYGPSGSGKTSLLLAGVFPELERRGHRPVYVRTLSNPEADLHEALRRAWLPPLPPPASIQGLIAGLTGKGPLVIAFDQFEEFFIRFRGAPEERQRFIELLGDLQQQDRFDLRILFSIRQEWVSELDDFRGVLPGRLEGEYRLRLLTAFGARQAIASQLEHAQVDYEPRLLLKLVDALEEYNFDPTVLQLLCSELYRRAAARRRGGPIRLTVEDLKQVGGLSQIFKAYLDDFTASLPEDAKLTARAVLDAMTLHQYALRQ